MRKKLRLTAFAPDDDAELIGWFPNADALRLFAGETLTWPLTSVQLDALRTDPRVHAWTGWTTGGPALGVAHAELVRVDDERARLARVAVAPAHRRLGLGAELIGEMLAEAGTLGMRHVELNVYANNSSARRLYRAAGFEDGDAPANGLVRMARTLA
jgi:ribosomal protein S18 acetylase RimI-like enzyme